MEENQKVSYTPKKKAGKRLEKKKGKVVLIKPSGAIIVSVGKNNLLLGVKESKKYKNIKIGDEIEI